MDLVRLVPQVNSLSGHFNGVFRFELERASQVNKMVQELIRPLIRPLTMRGPLATARRLLGGAPEPAVPTGCSLSGGVSPSRSDPTHRASG
jgi:hypothetical protein